MDIRKTVTFGIKAYTHKKTYYQIRMRVSYNSLRIDTCVGYSLTTREDWDEGKLRVKPGRIGMKNATARQINHRMDEFYKAAFDCFDYYEGNGIVPQPSDFRNRLISIMKPDFTQKKNTPAQE